MQTSLSVLKNFKFTLTVDFMRCKLETETTSGVFMMLEILFSLI